jgi:myo-inositol-1(or 4)-monophosphatase
VPESPESLALAAADCARSAGALVADYFRAGPTVRTKGGDVGNLVTDADEASEALIVGELRRRFPRHGILAEEGSSYPGDDIVWHVDPLDGTNNFAHGLPVFAVTLAAARGEEVLGGATYDPLRDELFVAWRGGGAWCNGARLHVSTPAVLAEALVITGFPYDKATNPDNNLREVAAVVPRIRGLRRLGSAALDLAYVAAGRVEAYWERGPVSWDVAAGLLLVAEAGGRVSDYRGAAPRLDGDKFVASNGHVHDELLALLSGA